MDQAIVGFHLDELGDWVADLACGHTQHVRHDPPWENRPWVIDPGQRQEKLGTLLDCLKCNMPRIPGDCQPYKQTPSFDEHSIPAGLLKNHSTKAGVWGKIVIESGELQYIIEAGKDGSPQQGWLLDEAFAGVVEPTVLHRIKPQGPVKFHVVFYRRSTS